MYERSKLRKSAEKRIYAISDVLWRKGRIAHHGLERNGTNFLRACCVAVGARPINFTDPQPGNPTHKHYRWYSDKTNISKILVEGVAHEHSASSTDDLNAIAAYPPHTGHLVIQKSKVQALASMYNYCHRKRWITSEEDIKSVILCLNEDYDSYYNFWANMEIKEPGRVSIVDYLALTNDPHILEVALQKLGIRSAHYPKRFYFSNLEMSPQTREIYISAEEVSRILNKLKKSSGRPLGNKQL